MWFYRLQNEHYFTKERIVNADVVSDVTCMRQNDITRVVLGFLWPDVIHCQNNSNVIW